MSHRTGLYNSLHGLCVSDRDHRPRSDRQLFPANRLCRDPSPCASGVHCCVAAEPFDPLLWFDLLVKAHPCIDSLAGVSTFLFQQSFQPLRRQSGRRHMLSGRSGTATFLPPRSQHATRPHSFYRPVLRSPHPGGLPFAQDPPSPFGSAEHSARLVLIWLLSFRGLGLLGLRLPGGRITRFCTAASRNPGLGTSRRLTIP